jgi:hypothetical protein
LKLTGCAESAQACRLDSGRAAKGAWDRSSFSHRAEDGGGQSVLNAMQFHSMFERPAKKTAAAETAEPVLALAVA